MYKDNNPILTSYLKDMYLKAGTEMANFFIILFDLLQ